MTLQELKELAIRELKEQAKLPHNQERPSFIRGQVVGMLRLYRALNPTADGDELFDTLYETYEELGV